MNPENQPPASIPEPGADSAPYPQRPDGRRSHSAPRGRSGGRHGGRGGQHRGRGSRWAAVVGGAAALIAVAGGGYTVVRSATDPTDQTRSAAGAAPATDPTGASGTPSGASAAPHSTTPATPSPRASITARPSTQHPVTRPATTAAPRTTGPANGTTGAAKGTDAGGHKAPSSDTLTGGGTTDRFAQQVVDMVNTERARQGCGPVTVNARIQAAAQAHSDDMAARDYYEHDTPEGVGPGARMTSAGYRWSTWGENIYKSPRDARTAMDGWMKSPGHRDNILNCAFKEIGVGISLARNGPWWTQDFGAAS